MRPGISISLTDADRERLDAIVRDRNSPQKHVWRARIVLLTAAGLGTNAVMRETGKSETCVWRWQERFMAAGLVRDKTRRLHAAPPASGVPPLPQCRRGQGASRQARSPHSRQLRHPQALEGDGVAGRHPRFVFHFT